MCDSAADLGLFLLSFNTCRSFSVHFDAGTALRCPTHLLSVGQLGASRSRARKQGPNDIFHGSPSVLAWKVLQHSHLGWEDRSAWLISYGSSKFFFRLVIEPPPWQGRGHFSSSSPALVAALLSHFCQSVGWKVVVCFSVHPIASYWGDFFIHPTAFGDRFLCTALIGANSSQDGTRVWLFRGALQRTETLNFNVGA